MTNYRSYVELEPCRHVTCVFQGMWGGGCQDKGVVGWVELGPWHHLTCVFRGVPKQWLGGVGRIRTLSSCDPCVSGCGGVGRISTL